MRKAFVGGFCIIVSALFVSCDKDDDNKDREKEHYMELCSKLVSTDTLPAVITDPYVTITSHIDLSHIDYSYDFATFFSYLEFEELSLSWGYAINPEKNRIEPDKKQVQDTYVGLYNHTHCTYTPAISVWPNNKIYECASTSFYVDIDEESLAVTEDVKEELSTNAVTLSCQVNMNPEYINEFSTFIYCSTDSITNLDNLGISRSSVELDANGHGSISLSDLHFNTKYYYMTVVRHGSDVYSWGASYRGKVKSFTTPAMQAVVITDDAPEKIEFSGITLSFDVKPVNVSMSSLVSGVCYASHPEPTILDEHSTMYFAPGSCIVSKIHSGTDLEPNTTYYFRAYTRHSCDVNSDNSCAIIYGEEKSFTTPDVTIKNEDTDMGSSIWTSCNVGASNPWELGNTYNYYGVGSEGSDSLVCTDGWHVPTRNEWNELVLNSNRVAISYHGNPGILVTSKNGNSLFFPETVDGYWVSDEISTVICSQSLYFQGAYANSFGPVRLVRSK